MSECVFAWGTRTHDARLAHDLSCGGHEFDVIVRVVQPCSRVLESVGALGWLALLTSMACSFVLAW